MKIKSLILFLFFCELSFSQTQVDPGFYVISLESPPAPPVPITSNYPFEIILRGTCNILKDTSGVFFNEKDLSNFWHYYFGNDVPSVDFEKNMVAIIKRTISNEQDIVISGVVDSFKRLNIYTELSSPYTCKSYRDTNRYVLVLLPLNSKPVKIF